MSGHDVAAPTTNYFIVQGDSGSGTRLASPELNGFFRAGRLIGPTWLPPADYDAASKVSVSLSLVFLRQFLPSEVHGRDRILDLT